MPVQRHPWNIYVHNVLLAWKVLNSKNAYIVSEARIAQVTFAVKSKLKKNSFQKQKRGYLINPGPDKALKVSLWIVHDTLFTTLK